MVEAKALEPADILLEQAGIALRRQHVGDVLLDRRSTRPRIAPCAAPHAQGRDLARFGNLRRLAGRGGR